jgi:hypothetical protein
MLADLPALSRSAADRPPATAASVPPNRPADCNRLDQICSSAVRNEQNSNLSDGADATPREKPEANVRRHHQVPDLMFDSTLIDDMSLDKSPAEESSAKGLAATNSAKRNLSQTHFVPWRGDLWRSGASSYGRDQSTPIFAEEVPILYCVTGRRRIRGCIGRTASPA